MKIGSAVKLIRKFRNETQLKVARQAGISRTMIVELEGTDSNPSWNTLLGLSIAFEMPLSRIIEIAELLHQGNTPEVPEVQNLLVNYAKNISVSRRRRRQRV